MPQADCPAAIAKGYILRRAWIEAERLRERVDSSRLDGIVEARAAN